VGSYVFLRIEYAKDARTAAMLEKTDEPKLTSSLYVQRLSVGTILTLPSSWAPSQPLSVLCLIYSFGASLGGTSKSEWVRQ